MRLIFRRIRIGLGTAEAFCFLAYCAIVLSLVPYHEPWTDEAQGWLIANSCSLKTILGRVLHYEVAPPLWQITLFPLVKAHLNFHSANWLSAGLGILAAYVVLRYAPFPRLIRCLLPFTFFLQYQYALIARPYGFFPLLLFVLCVLYRRGQSRSVLFACVAGLLANINLHCTVYAVALFAVCVLKSRWPQDPPPQSVGFWTRPRSRGLAFAIFFTALAVVIVTAFPAPDQFMSGPLQRLKPITSRVILPERVPAGMVADPPVTVSMVLAPRLRSSVGRLFRHLAEVGLHTISTILYPISQYNLLSAAFLLLCAGWLIQRRQWLLLLPLAGMVLAFFILPVAGYHTGLFFVAVIASLWMGWPEGQAFERSWLFIAFASACVAVILTQIDWAVRADIGEVRGDYDPSQAAAQYLQAKFPGGRIAAFSYGTETLQLYEPIHPLGWQHPFWTWSEASQPNSYKASILAMHPDVVVTGTASPGDRTIEQQFKKGSDGPPVGEDVTTWWQNRGWRETRRFCGKHFGFGGYEYQPCLNVLEPPSK